MTDPMGLDGFGNDIPDWLDDNVDYARNYWKGDIHEWERNGSVDTLADLAGGFADDFRIGSGIGQAYYCEDNAYGKAAYITMDIFRASSTAGTILGATASRFSCTPKWASPIDKFSRTPKSLQDQMVLDAAKSGAGDRLAIKLKDRRYRWMQKVSYGETSAAGLRSEVHYVRNPVTGRRMDFKFKHHAEKYR